MAFKAKKTEHAGAKKGRGAYWGRKVDAKQESNRKRREDAKAIARHVSGNEMGMDYCAEGVICPASAAATSSFLVARLKTRDNSVWLMAQALRSFFVRAISYTPSAIRSSEVPPVAHRIRFLSCERSLGLV